MRFDFKISDIDIDGIDIKYKDLVMPISKDDYKRLENDISLNSVEIPIHLLKTSLTILDGHNRYNIAKKLQHKTIPAILVDGFKTEQDIEEYIINTNLNRRHLTTAQKAELGLKLLEIERIRAKERQGARTDLDKDNIPMNSKGSDESGEARELAAKKTGISSDTLYKAQKIKDFISKDTPQARIVKRKWDDAQINGGKESVHSVYRVVDNITKDKDKDKLISTIDVPNSLQFTNVWIFEQCDKKYGNQYPGRMPGQIIENLLWFYTEPKDLVIDPMAGSGTTGDVCKSMSRRCLMFDLVPSREDIKKNDITKQFPNINEKARLIVLDPPYSNQKKGEYTDIDTDLSNMPIKEFYKNIEKILETSKEYLLENGKIVLIVSPLKKEGKVYDLAFNSYNIFLNSGYNFIERIIVPYKNASSFSGFWIDDAKKNKRMLRNYRDLMIFEVAK